ncbi:hypothetical protein [Caminibacter sp.]
MKEIFKYTFTTIAEWQKFLFIVITISILTLIEPYPFIGYTALIFEKLILLSVGVFLIYLLKHSKSIDSYFENLKNNGFGTFMFHFIPAAAGILIGIFLILGFWFMFLLIILQYTNSLFILANPHEILYAISKTNIITQILLGFYLVYLLFYSYIFLGKFGDALNKQSFKAAFISIILSLFDFKYWVKTFNLKYFLIYLVWSVIIFASYIFISLVYILIIYPTIIHNPNISLIAIPLLVAFSLILTYYTFFSAYFANKTTGN